MNRRSTIQWLGAFAWFAPWVRAHKLHYSLTELFWRQDQTTLEIVHSFHLDDAMTLLTDVDNPSGELPAATQARLLLYAEQHFKLSQAGRRLTLEPVGAQIDGNYLWIYQEHLMPHLPTPLRVECTLMHDVSPRHQNQVNLRIGDAVRTLTFRKGATIGEF